MKKPISELKTYFETGDKPIQQQFWDLIDSFVHKDDGVTIKTIEERLGGYRITLSNDEVIGVPILKYPTIGKPVFVSKGRNNGIQNNSETEFEPGDFFRMQVSETIYWNLAMYMGDINGNGISDPENSIGLSVINIEIQANFNP